MKKIFKILLLIAIAISLVLVMNCSGIQNREKIAGLEEQVLQLETSLEQMQKRLDGITVLLKQKREERKSINK